MKSYETKLSSLLSLLVLSRTVKIISPWIFDLRMPPFPDLHPISPSLLPSLTCQLLNKLTLAKQPVLVTGLHRGPMDGYMYGGERKVLEGPLEEATPEPHDTCTWWLLWDSPEARSGVPLFLDPEAAGPRCTLGPQSPGRAGPVLAAAALPPAGRHRHCPVPGALTQPGEGLQKHSAPQNPGARGLLSSPHHPIRPPYLSSHGVEDSVEGDALFLWAGLGSAVLLPSSPAPPTLHPISTCVSRVPG